VHERSFKGQTRTVIAACDARLLGKVLKGRNGVVLNLKLHRAFYEGEKVNGMELAEILKGAINVNLVGDETIAAASKALPVKKEYAKKIAGVPHLQFYRI
jgi:hypothetical protein